jgi:transposase
MIVRTIKLRLSNSQEVKLEQWLWNLTGLWNWAVKKIEHDAHDGIYHSPFDLANLIAGHSKRMDIPSHTMRALIEQAHTSWQRCFKKLAKKPHLKGRRNELRSVPFKDPIKPPVGNKIGLPGLGKVRFHSQTLPDGSIKCGRVVKKASGWYLCLFIDAEHKFAVKETDAIVGIDPGFKTLLTLSDGTKIENPRELRKGAERLAQAQRSGKKQLAARIQERQANRRNDRNHKISRKLVENYKTICYSDDNFKGMAKLLGKSVAEAGLGDLIGKLSYKCRTGGRNLVPVKSNFTTMTCSNCGALTGPTGLDGLAVRSWGCACGAQHDRDLNASRMILKIGLGWSLKEASNGLK